MKRNNSIKIFVLISLIIFCSLPSISQANQSFCTQCEELHKIQPPFFKILNGHKSIHGLQLSPDSQWLGFAIRDSKGRNGFIKTDLYVIPTSGGQVQKINTDWPKSGTIESFRFSPDSKRILFTAKKDQNYKTNNRLYWVDLIGNKFNKYNEEHSIEGPIFLPKVSSNGQYIVYSNKNTSSGLFSLDLNAINKKEIKIAPPRSQDVFLSSDNHTIYFIEDQRKKGAPIGHQQLYQTTLLGGIKSILNKPLLSTPWSSVVDYWVSKDEKHIVYNGNIVDEHAKELFSTNLKTGSKIKISKTFQPRGQIWEATLSNDSQYVVYLADLHLKNVHELYSAVIDKEDSQIKLSPNWIGELPQNQKALNTYNASDVLHYSVSANSKYVLMETSKGFYFNEIRGNKLIKFTPKENQKMLGFFYDRYILSSHENEVPHLELISNKTGKQTHLIKNAYWLEKWQRQLSDADTLYFLRDSTTDKRKVTKLISIQLDKPEIENEISTIPISKIKTLVKGVDAKGNKQLFFSTQEDNEIKLWKLKA